MNTTTIEKEPQKILPQLIKQSATYKLFVPKKVEEKIRYLIRKFPHTEWSGVLFYTHTGSFETNDLEIHCEDLYPMDLGTGGWTEFKMTEDVTRYIADNIVELFNCDQGLIHSHHTMGAFFSGQDDRTLQTEGNDTNCFVSLIVDTKGTYKAAITRKVQEKKTIVTKDFSSTYEFFGEGEKTANVLTGPTQETVVESVRIEAFMLDVEREVADNPYDFLDKRFDEIEEAKKKTTAINPPVIKVSENNHSPWIPNKTSVVNSASNVFDNDFDEDYSFRDWQLKQQEKKEPTLFSDSEMNEMIDISSWEPDPTIIHKLVCQMVTCSLIVGENIDLKQWIVKWMDKKYKEIFGFDSTESSQFQEWKDFIVEFMVNQYSLVDNTIPTGIVDDWDLIQSKVASAMFTELYQYAPDGTNPYIDDYKEILMRYIYE